MRLFCWCPSMQEAQRASTKVFRASGGAWDTAANNGSLSSRPTLRRCAEKSASTASLGSLNCEEF